jgi:hypothetical protein
VASTGDPSSRHLGRDAQFRLDQIGAEAVKGEIQIDALAISSLLFRDERKKEETSSFSAFATLARAFPILRSSAGPVLLQRRPLQAVRPDKAGCASVSQ